MSSYRERVDRILKEEAEAKIAEASRITTEKAEAAKRESEEIQRHNRSVLEAQSRINTLFNQLDVNRRLLRLKDEIWQGLGTIEDISEPPVKDSTGRLSPAFRKGAKLIYRYDVPGEKKYKSHSKREYGPYSVSGTGDRANESRTEVGWNTVFWEELGSFETREVGTSTEVRIDYDVESWRKSTIFVIGGLVSFIDLSPANLSDIIAMKSFIDNALLEDAVYRTKNDGLPFQLRDKARQEISELYAEIGRNKKRSFFGKLFG